MAHIGSRERNFHVFYYMFAGMPEEILRYYYLEDPMVHRLVTITLRTKINGPHLGNYYFEDVRGQTNKQITDRQKKNIPKCITLVFPSESFFFFFRLFPIRGRHSGLSISSCSYRLYPSTSAMSSFTTSINLLFGLPRFLFPGNSILSIAFSCNHAVAAELTARQPLFFVCYGLAYYSKWACTFDNNGCANYVLWRVKC